MKGYMSAREASRKRGVSESRAHRLCRAAGIPGRERAGGSRAVPCGAESAVPRPVGKAKMPDFAESGRI